jgi:hypothetical protein
MNLHETFNSLSLAQIEEFLRAGQEETLHLEFKTVSKPDLSDKHDKRNFACALSGFANSDGGLILWGVDARKDADGIDRASAPAEISSVSLFVSRLGELTGDAVLPRIDGIVHRAIPRDNGMGFGVTLVPESDSGPHMAKLGENRYYKRSGSSFYLMEHFDIADMFGRRRRPLLALGLELVPRLGDDPHEEFHVEILNAGRGIAKYTGFICTFDADVKVADVSRHLQNSSSLNRGAPIVSYQDNEGVVQPNGIASAPGYAILKRARKGNPLRVQLTWYCENMQARTALVELKPSEKSWVR